MLRRCHVPLARALADWSALGAVMANSSSGRCFDATGLQPSTIPTRHLQLGLLRLPIPKLEDTLRRYEEAIAPIVPPVQWEKSRQIIKEFGQGLGQKLQAELLATDRANMHTSYISADWFDLYLRDRTPLPIHYNPSLVARYDPNKRDGVLRAAYWIASAVRWYKLYLNNELRPEVFYFVDDKHYARQDWFNKTMAMLPQFIAPKAMLFGSNFNAFPLDMSQYDNLLNSTRLPGALVDRIKGGALSFAPHIIVLHRGHQFKVTVADNECNPLPEEQIYARLMAIKNLNITPAQYDVGIFTSMRRDDWNGVRTSLERQPANKASLELIDSALFALALDTDTTTDVTTHAGAVAANRHFLVAPVSRWWDKALTVITTADGALAVSFEHSWGDGVAVLRHTVDCFNDSIRRPATFCPGACRASPSEPVQQLQWVLSDAERTAHGEALKRFQRDIANMDFTVAIADGIGRHDKAFRGSVKADPFLQVAMQLAWWRLNRSIVSTYESASTAAFKRGRTECIRSATMESAAFAMAMSPAVAPKEQLSRSALFGLLKAATRKHAAISKDAKMGQGVDRHLFALRKLAERNGIPTPTIFSDPSYATLGSNMLSTSSLYSEALIGGGFGPVSPGYGIGYAAADEVLQFNISCWKDGPRHTADEFGQALLDAVEDMRDLILEFDDTIKQK